jgi:hypothetical protein
MEVTDLTWCELPKGNNAASTKAASYCGKALHTDCVKRWLAAIKTSNATCPYCRAPWNRGGGGEGKAGGVGSAESSGAPYVNLWQLQTNDPQPSNEYEGYSFSYYRSRHRY